MKQVDKIGRPEGEGFSIALSAIDARRVSVAAQRVGIAQGAFAKALAYAKELLP